MKKQDITSQHIKLIKSIVSRYKSRVDLYDDLVQEGMLGLLEAQKRFDPGQGVQFSTYATYWIKKYISRYFKQNNIGQQVDIDDSQMIQIPDNKSVRVKQRIDLPQNMPSPEKTVLKLFFEQQMDLNEISKKIGISREKTRQIKQKALRRLKLFEQEP